MGKCSKCNESSFDEFRMNIEGHCTNCDSYGCEDLLNDETMKELTGETDKEYNKRCGVK